MGREGVHYIVKVISFQKKNLYIYIYIYIIKEFKIV